MWFEKENTQGNSKYTKRSTHQNQNLITSQHIQQRNKFKIRKKKTTTQKYQHSNH